MEVDKTINFLLSSCPFTYPFKIFIRHFYVWIEINEEHAIKNLAGCSSH